MFAQVNGHLRARQYDPTAGRFLSIDPLEREIEQPYISAYAYADNKPTVLIDPSGMRGMSVDTLLRPAPVEAPPVPVPPRIPWWKRLPKKIPPVPWGVGCMVLCGPALGYGIYKWDPGNYTDFFEREGAEFYDYLTRNDNPRGERLYRVAGGEAPADGNYWTTVDPRAVSDARGGLGLPDDNSGEFLVVGVLIDESGVRRGEAEGYDSEKYGRYMRGGLPEVFVPLPRTQIVPLSVIRIAPPF